MQASADRPDCPETFRRELVPVAVRTPTASTVRLRLSSCSSNRFPSSSTMVTPDRCANSMSSTIAGPNGRITARDRERTTPNATSLNEAVSRPRRAHSRDAPWSPAVASRSTATILAPSVNRSVPKRAKASTSEIRSAARSRSASIRRFTAFSMPVVFKVEEGSATSARWIRSSMSAAILCSRSESCWFKGPVPLTSPSPRRRPRNVWSRSSSTGKDLSG